MPIHDDDDHSSPHYRPYVSRRPATRRQGLWHFLSFIGTAAVVVAMAIGLFSWMGNSMHEAEAAENAALADASAVWSTTSTVKLASMSSATTNDTSGGGAALFGSGTFVVRTSEDQQLRYIAKRSDGGFTMESTSAESAVIYEIDDDSEPRIETQACHLEASEPEHQKWLKDHNSECRDLDGSSFDDASRIRVYVPEGTVVDTFSIDAKN